MRKKQSCCYLAVESYNYEILLQSEKKWFLIRNEESCYERSSTLENCNKQTGLKSTNKRRLMKSIIPFLLVAKWSIPIFSHKLEKN